ncbi:drug/metabolite transporter (DMT)-like permease [Pullulanibacillus pueri]|uniref:EamA domain-containing protein n=1 Tax=Pullulanibacillus pueri TaxID=1437324 RepID=A0A8J3EK21_9BACL|nr:DMT family transporter [Pullulanibacillus pueri]MBM7680257.1 drug/metabolite transporter (DMT)-like permease [Pullulanibacillus pueri]GGH75987.1 hypothetical protein GCM10007096_05760 [Pullulanibacillus pueri]
MAFSALVLVLISSFIHATWNLLQKQAQTSGLAFSWLFNLMGVLAYTPLIIIVVIFWQPHLSWLGVVFIAVSSLIHVGYFLLLQKGYKVSDLSIVYPISRGLGPVFAMILAVLFLSESPSSLTLVGTGVIVVAIFFIAGGIKMIRGNIGVKGPLFGLGVAILIGWYTTWDKYAVDELAVMPLFYEYLGMVGQFLILSPFAYQRKAEVVKSWRLDKWQAAGVGILSPLAYILALTALAMAPVTYIAPLRELSIVIGTLFGIFILKEKSSRMQIVYSGVLFLGVVFVALSS